MLATKSLRMIQPTQRMMMRPTRRMLKVPDEEQSAHTISQRLRRLRQIPPELIPIGVVVGIALGFAAYSLGNKFVVDKTMRVSRQNRKD